MIRTMPYVSFRPVSPLFELNEKNIKMIKGTSYPCAPPTSNVFGDDQLFFF